MLKWLIKHSRWVLNKKGQLISPQGLQQGVARQFQGIRQLGLAELQRKQQMEDFRKKLEIEAQIKQQIAAQDPLQQFLQQGKVAQAIQNISAAGGDVSQFQGIFGGGARVQAPAAQPSVQPTVGVPSVSAGIPQIGGGPSIQPTVPEVRPTKFEIEKRPLSPQFGKLIPTAFEKIPTQEELDKKAEQDARTAGIKKQVLDKLKGLPGESAGKLTMLQQALFDLEDVEKLLFTEGGKGELIKGLATVANLPGGRAFGIGTLIPEITPFGGERTRTLARQINSKMNNALEAKLRIETGAAATQEEFDRLQTRFGITGFDTTASARDKIKRLKAFFKNATVTIDPTGRFIYKTGDTQLDNELNPLQIFGVEKVGE